MLLFFFILLLPTEAKIEGKYTFELHIHIGMSLSRPVIFILMGDEYPLSIQKKLDGSTANFHYKNCKKILTLLNSAKKKF